MSADLQNMPENKISPDATDSHNEPLESVESNDTETENGTETEGESETTRRQRGLREEERVMLAKFVAMSGESMDDVIPWTNLTREMKVAVLPSSKIKLTGKGLLEVETNIDTGAITSVKVCPQVLDTYYDTSNRESLLAKLSETRDTPVKTRAPKVDTAEDFRKIRIMRETNPRPKESQGWFNWKLYKNDDTVSQYLARMDYKRDDIASNGRYFNGPAVTFLDHDMKKGNIRLYDSRETEKLEDGSDNPKFWLASRIVQDKPDTDQSDDSEEETSDSGK